MFRSRVFFVCVCVCSELRDLFAKASVCSAGDSAAYQRTAVFGDDVVIVA